MKQAIILLNHTLTSPQIDELRERFGVDEIVSLPEDLQECWANVPPELESLDNWLQPFYDFISKIAKANDVMVVQGDLGATLTMVEFSFIQGFLPLYATSKRESKENAQGKKTSYFKHMQFRRYR